MDERGYTALHFAAEQRANHAVITALLAAGADATAVNVADWTPLHWAVEHKENSATIATLIAAAANDSFAPSRYADHNGVRNVRISLENGLYFEAKRAKISRGAPPHTP